MVSFKELTKDLNAAMAPATRSRQILDRALRLFSLHVEDLSYGTTDMRTGHSTRTKKSYQEISPRIEEAIGMAVSLEFATIPIYLTALWSIKDQEDAVAKSVRAIAHEEMLHFALSCNLLSALGMKPNLVNGKIPSYPGNLPGELYPTVQLTLSGLTDSNLRKFIAIEQPAKPIPIEDSEGNTVEDSAVTIGEFYEALRQAFHTYRPNLSIERQLAGPLAPMVIPDLDALDKAIDLIVSQGEGGGDRPYGDGSNDLAHYYRFAEILIKQHLEWDQTNKRMRKVAPLPRPAIYEFIPAPQGGYGPETPEEILRLAGRFNEIYSRMLDDLEAAWGMEGHSSLLLAIEKMFDLQELARKMMSFSGANGKGYGPEFIYLHD